MKNENRHLPMPSPCLAHPPGGHALGHPWVTSGSPMGHPRVMPGLGVPGPRGAHGVPTGAHGGCPQVAHWVPTGCGISREISREIGCGIAGGGCPLSRRPSCRAARRARLGGVLRPGRAGTPSGLCVGGCRLALGVKFVAPCYHTVPEHHTALASDLDTQPCRLVSR